MMTNNDDLVKLCQKRGDRAIELTANRVRKEYGSRIIELEAEQEQAAARIRELEARNNLLQMMVDGLVGESRTHAIVPLEPTSAMIEAGMEYWGDTFMEPSDMDGIYRAVIRAALQENKE
jgi:uncharacterized protein YPO0396